MYLTGGEHGIQKWVTYPRSYSLYIAESRFKLWATGRMLLAHGLNLLSEARLYKWQMVWLGLEDPGLWLGTLWLRSLHPRQSQISVSEGERQCEVPVPDICVGRVWVYLWAWVTPDVYALWAWAQCLLLICPEHIFPFAKHQFKYPPMGFLGRVNRDDVDP